MSETSKRVCEGCGCSAAYRDYPHCSDCLDASAGDIVMQHEHAGACISVGMRALCGRRILEHVASPADSTSTKGEHLCWCGKPGARARPSWCGNCDPLDDDRVAALAALARECPVTPADLDALRTEILERVATACDRIDKAQDVVEGLVRAMSRAP